MQGGGPTHLPVCCRVRPRSPLEASWRRPGGSPRFARFLERFWYVLARFGLLISYSRARKIPQAVGPELGPESGTPLLGPLWKGAGFTAQILGAERGPQNPIPGLPGVPPRLREKCCPPAGPLCLAVVVFLSRSSTSPQADPEHQP